MSRRVLITGAGGFVGSHLAEGFMALDYTVTAFDRSFDAPTRQRL
jgi:nucleoside-diphosphate-sugar epimerase